MSTKVLTLGRMSGHEIAEWFGITYNTYQNRAARYLEILQNEYADCAKVYGGVMIYEIYEPIYRKNLSKEVAQKYLDAVLESENGLCSVTGISILTDENCYQLTKARNVLFGEEPTNVNPHAKPGTCGTRSFVWAIRCANINAYRYLTPEEDLLFSGLIQQVYKDIDPEIIKNQNLISDYCVAENLSHAEYLRLISVTGCNFYSEVIKKFQKHTGFQLVRATKHEVDESIRIREEQRKLEEQKQEN